MFGAVVQWLKRKASEAPRREIVLEWLREHPDWWYASDIVEAGICGRARIFVILGNLEEEGYVEMRQVITESGLPRTQYRATGKRSPGKWAGRHAAAT